MITGCSIDLKSKEMAKAALQTRSIPLIENIFELSYAENYAIAFSFLNNIAANIRIPLIFTLTISATLMVFYMIWRIREKQFRILLPFFVILGGAYGNIIDRGMHGFVTDFFYAHYHYEYNFPVFNVADILVNIGIFLVIIQWKDFNAIFNALSHSSEEGKS